MSGVPIAVVGASGQVARALVRAAAERGQALAIGGRPDVDLTDAASISAFLDRAAPSLVINAAAYTAVDKAETDTAAAVALNVEGPARLAAWCASRGVPLIHISTDFVFDGRASKPYREDDVRNPLSVYGRTKSDGEDAVRAALAQHIIVRTAWVYGANGNNFLKTMLRLGAERDVVRVVADQHGTPTSADDIAGAILDIAKHVGTNADLSPWGTYHLVAGGETTWHGLAAEIFARASQAGLKTPKLEAITTADYPTPAARPAYSVLDTSKIRAAFGIALPPWQKGVADCVRQLANQKQ
jgi:dTDP-4-dehydrorhamnose reductase